MRPVIRAADGAVSEHRAPWATLAKYLLAVVGVAFLAAVVILPAAHLFQIGFGGGLSGFWQSISSPEALFSLRFSLALALATTVINGVMGTVVAFTLANNSFPFRGLLDALVDLPLIIPPGSYRSHHRAAIRAHGPVGQPV